GVDREANIEIKPCPGREIETAHAVVDVVQRDWPRNRPWPLLSSFSHASLGQSRTVAPDIPRGLLTWEFAADWADAAEALGCVSIHCADEYLTPTWAAAIRDAGFGLAVYTVNDPARAVELKGRGAQCLIPDRPHAISQVV